MKQNARCNTCGKRITRRDILSAWHHTDNLCPHRSDMDVAGGLKPRCPYCSIDDGTGHQAAPEFVGAGGHQPGRFDPEV